MMKRAFSGFAQLPPPGESTIPSWRDVFGVSEGINDIDYIRHKYKSLSSVYHPDKQGGSSEKMAELNAAWVQAQEELKS